MDKQIKEYTRSGKKNLIIIYILYLCGVVAHPVALIGAVFAYVNKDSANNRLEASHYIFLFRTFCFGFFGYIISWVTMIIAIGIVLQFALAIWYVLRVGIGFKYLIEDEPHPNPMTYWIN